MCIVTVQLIECEHFVAAAASNKHRSEAPPPVRLWLPRSRAPPQIWRFSYPHFKLTLRGSVVVHCSASPLVKCHLHGIFNSAPCYADTVKQSRAYPVTRDCEGTRSPAQRALLRKQSIDMDSVERTVRVVFVFCRGGERGSHAASDLLPGHEGKIRLPFHRKGSWQRCCLSVEQAGERVSFGAFCHHMGES